MNTKTLFNVDRIVEYLEKHKSKLEISWDEKGDVKIPDFIDSNNIVGLGRFEKEILLKKLVKEKFDEGYNKKKLYNWIIIEWGGISGGNEENQDYIEKFLENCNNKYEFTRISSTSKVASFINPKENIIYDSRVTFALNWIILTQNAGTKFFPIPEGRNSKLKAFDLNVLIRLKNITSYQPNNEKSFNNKKFINNIDQLYYIKKNDAYFVLNELIKSVNKKLWKEDEEKKEYLYYTEMLLFQLADNEIYKDIVSKVKLNIS